MAILYFSDILFKAGIDPKEVKLIRHSLTDKAFKDCYDAGKVMDYTAHQKPNFSKGYKYWAVFISGTGTYARFHSIYKVGNSRPDTEDMIPEGMPEKERVNYKGEIAVFDLERLEDLYEFENKLTIDWGNSARSWHQKGINDKPVISIAPDEKKVFTGFENLVKTYDELKEIFDNPEVYESWHTALKSVYAVYLIVDTKTGQQYVGSAYGKDGLFGRWSEYIKTYHGGNKKMKKVIEMDPERFHHFQFSILQILPKTITDEEVIHIEHLWMSKLCSIEFGMN